MKAEEARRIATDVLSANLAEDYEMVIQEITEAVNFGKLGMIYDNSLEAKTIERLKSDGYGVRQFQAGINEYSYEITW